jgi:hypothetical protein
MFQNSSMTGQLGVSSSFISVADKKLLPQQAASATFSKGTHDACYR